MHVPAYHQCEVSAVETDSEGVPQPGRLLCVLCKKPGVCSPSTQPHKQRSKKIFPHLVKKKKKNTNSVKIPLDVFLNTSC